MVRSARAIRFTAGITLILAASLSFGADRPPAGTSQGTPEAPQRRERSAPSRHGGRTAGEARLGAVKIVGATERPAILFFLPRAKFRLLPLRPEPDPATRILRDDKFSAEAPGS